MRKKFEILKLDSNDFTFIVFSLDRSRLDDYVLEVEKKLRKTSLKGQVIFDLILSNGTSDRYYTIFFNGESFDYTSIHILNPPLNEILEISKSFYKKNIEFIDKSILNSAQIYLLKKDFLLELH